MKCKQCKSKDFTITEVIIYKAVVEDNILKTYKVKVDEIDTINCSRCESEYKQTDFETIEFNC